MNTTDNERDPQTGQFAPGNRLGRGNPQAGRAAKIRAALLDAITEDDMKTIVLALIEKAKGGDVIAARELFDRAMGKPTQGVDVTGQTGGLNFVFQTVDRPAIDYDAIENELRRVTSEAGALAGGRRLGDDR